MSNRFLYIGSVYLFLIEDNKILLQRRCNTGFYDGEYGVPAGHMEGEESPRTACAREIKEEIGIDLTVEDLECVHTMHRKCDDSERIDFFFTTKTYGGVIENCEPEKCDDLSWFPLDELPENMVEYVKVALVRSQAGLTYSEWDWE